MAANVLNSQRAIKASVFVVRAFVKLRQVVATHKELSAKLAELERRVASHDEAIRSIVATIRELIEPPAQESKKRIGFIETQDKRQKWAGAVMKKARRVPQIPD